MISSLSPQPLIKPNTAATLSPIPHVQNQRFKLASHVYPSKLPSIRKRPDSARAATTQHHRHLLVPAEEEGEEEREVKFISDAPALPAGLQRESMPRHVAVIMDGNRRWAHLRGLPVGSGYEAGIKSLKTLVELCCKWGIRVLTVFAFSSDNWFRPKVEVEFLMTLLESGVKGENESFVRESIRISVIGDISKLPKRLEELVINVVETTKHNTRFQLIVAVSYSGRYDLVQACQRIAMKVKDGLIEPNGISEFLIEQELETNCTEFPYPDLLIRTSGELRISNFMLWQLAYTELFFQNHCGPILEKQNF